jgi:hypothetical protein
MKASDLIKKLITHGGGTHFPGFKEYSQMSLGKGQQRISHIFQYQRHEK